MVPAPKRMCNLLKLKVFQKLFLDRWLNLICQKLSLHVSNCRDGSDRWQIGLGCWLNVLSAQGQWEPIRTFQWVHGILRKSIRRVPTRDEHLWTFCGKKSYFFLFIERPLLRKNLQYQPIMKIVSLALILLFPNRQTKPGQGHLQDAASLTGAKELLKKVRFMYSRLNRLPARINSAQKGGDAE